MTKMQSSLFGSVMFVQQYIVSPVLGAKQGERDALNSTHCHFKIRLSPMGGLQDFIRVALGSLRAVDVEVNRSLLLADLADQIGELQEESVSGIRYPPMDSTEDDDGFSYFVLYTLFPRD